MLFQCTNYLIASCQHNPLFWNLAKEVYHTFPALKDLNPDIVMKLVKF